jgi:hypothetical protein
LTLPRLTFVVAVALAPAARAGAGAEYLGAFTVDEQVAYFGGFSGVRFAAGGHTFIALSDSAALVSGQVDRDGRGAITAIRFDGPPRRLRDERGNPLEFPFDDSEGLSVAPDGSLFVSFEIRQRIARYAPDGRITGHLPVPTHFVDYEPNAGLESVALAPDGSVYTMPEGEAGGTPAVPVYRFRRGAWERPFDLPEDRSWRPVDADFGPDGRLYVLERDYWGLIGFMSRLRRFSFDGSGLTGTEVLFATPAGRHGNLEGLSIWRAADGRLHATLISDDNFLPRVATEFVDYTISE